MQRPRAGLAFLLVLIFVALPAAAEVAKPYGGATPEAVVERLTTAAAANDMAGVAACLTPDDRVTLALLLTAVTGMVIAFVGMGTEMAGGMEEEMAGDEGQHEMEAPETAAAEANALKERFEEIMERYGIEDPMGDSSSATTGEDAPEGMPAGVDQVDLIADLMALLEAMPGEDQADGTSPMDIPEGELQELVIDGDHATGRMGDEDVELVRVDGRWYLSLDLAEQMEAREPTPENE